MRRHKRKRHVEGRILAGTVLATAALAAIIVLSSLAGGASGSQNHIPKSCRTAAIPRPSPQRDHFMIEHVEVQLAEAEAQRIATLPRRRLIWQIDTWLQQWGSPMAGMGECYVENGERTGIPATLSVGIAEAESSSGLDCFAPHNAWGMIGPEYRGGFSSWQDDITANFDYLVQHFGCPQNMTQCPGYCVGDGTMQTVDDVMAAFGRLDAGWIQ